MKPRRFFFFAVFLSLVLRTAADAPYYGPPGPNLTSPAKAHADTSFATIGSLLIRDNHLDRLGWSDAQIAAFLEGVRAALHGEQVPADEDARQLANEIGEQLERLKNTPASATAATNPTPANQENLEDYLRKMQRKFLLQRSVSGMCYAVDPGQFGGLRPRPQDTVVVSLTCVASDGAKLPQFSLENMRIPVSALLPGLAEGVQMMTIDSRGRFVLPPKLSFGDGPWPPGVAPGSPLLCTLTLHQVIPGAAPALAASHP